MGAGVAAIVIEPRDIVREALASRLEKLQYRVSGKVASLADIDDPSIAGERCKLAILGAVSAEDGASDAAHIRSVWPDCKILLILESASCADLRELMDSGIDGCVPLEASADTLSKALDLIIVESLRVMIAGDSGIRLMPSAQRQPTRRLLIRNEALSIVIADLPEFEVKEGGASLASAGNNDRRMSGISPLRERNLSEREMQILDSLVKGHANKVIARTCAISEATVKVHMKSILRKIRVANRTQAAVWALEHGYCDEGPEAGP